MRQKSKYLFFNKRMSYVFIFLFILSACGVSKDTKEDISVISENTESIDKSIQQIDQSIQQIVKAVEGGGVQIVIKGVDLDELQELGELISNLNNMLKSPENKEDAASDLSDFGVQSVDELFNEGNSSNDGDIKEVLQDFKTRLTAVLEGAGSEDKEYIERLIEQITESLEGIEQ